MSTRRQVSVWCTAALLGWAAGCAAGDDGNGAAGGPGDETTDPTKPRPERTYNAALRVNEATIATRSQADGLHVRIPVTVGSGSAARATLQVTLTGLDSLDGPTASTSFPLTQGDQGVEVVLPDATLPDDQADQVLQLVRYRVTGAGPVVFGARSLYHTVPKLGLRLWAPDRMDAGSSTAVRVWATDLLTGDPLAGVDVTVGGQTATTDVAGQTELRVDAPADATAPLDVSARIAVDGVPAQVTRQIAVVPPGAPRLLASTDKPLYRPGQTMHIRALALAAKDLRPVADRPVVIEVMDGKENKVFQEQTVTDAYGVASLTAPLASHVNLGTYTIKAIMGDVEYVRTVEVSEEKLPKFAVTVALDAPYFAPGAPVTGVVKARYFFGKAVVGGSVTLQMGGTTLTGTTNAEGLMPFELTPAFASPITVTVQDTAGFSVTREANVTIAKPALNIQVIAESAVALPGVPVRAFVRATGPTGGPMAATCTASDTGVPTLVLDGSGIGVLEISGETTLTCEAGGLTGTAQVALPPTRVGGLIVRADRAIYDAGAPIALTVRADGVSEVYLDRVHRGRIVASTKLALTEGTATWDVTPDPSETGLLTFTAYHVGGDAQPVSAERLVYVRRAGASVSLTMDKSTYLPGGEAKLTFQVKDDSGQGKAAAIGVTIADEAVFALAGGVGAADVAGYFLFDDAPTAVRPHAMSPPTDSGQIAAALGLAGAQGEGASLVGVTAASLAATSRDLAHLQLNALADAFMTEAEAMVDQGTLTADNAVLVLTAMAPADYWGQPLGVTVTVPSSSYASYARVELRSSGADELTDTADDWSRERSIFLSSMDYTRGADAASSPQDASASGPGGNGGTTGGGTGGTGEPSEPAAKPRTEFPETLYVNPALITDGTGKAEVTIPLADAITEWRVSMIANTAGGLVASGLGGITVFQDFFVDADLPRRLTQNDVLSLPVGVFNFSDLPQEVTVTVTPAPWFTLLSGGSQTLSLSAGQSAATPFMIEVLEAGYHELHIAAKTSAFADAVVKTVQVVPDGQRIDLSQSGPLEATKSATVTFPPGAISGGNDAVLKIMGGPSAQLLDGVDALLDSPRGCFEPMMNSTWINALVLDYLAWTGQDSPALVATARANLTDGVQQCLTFECTGGGFTWFGNPDPAHPILTAFGLIMFRDIVGVGAPVDERMVARAQSWLLGQQDGTGAWFTTEGTKNQALPWDRLRTTCIALWGLSASDPGEPGPLGKAVSYVRAAVDNDVDTYTLAMCANALLSAAPGDVANDALLAELLGRAHTEGETTYWDSDYPGVTYASGDVIQVETTALVLQALLSLETPPVIVESGLKFVAGKKSPDGNFLSTQGTIQALRAFVMAAKLAADGTNMDVVVRAGDQVLFSGHVDKTNRDVVNLIGLGELAAAGDVPLTIELSGEGKLYYQLASRHYLPWDPGTRRVGPLTDIQMTWAPVALAVGESTTATVTVTTTGADGAGPGDMPMVEFGIPPGFDADLSPLDDRVKSDPMVARYEVKGDRVQIYLHEIPAVEGVKAFEISIPMSPRFPMTVTTAAARTWPFYEPKKVSESLPVVLTVSE